MGPGTPFPDDLNESSIDPPSLTEQLTTQSGTPPLGDKPGCEAWSAAWSPDGIYFAWSCGHRIVKLVPWNRYKHTTLARDDKDLDGLPLESCHVTTIDAGDLVWSVAFGSSSAETKPHSTSLNWYRYKRAGDLMLATGLSNGKIRVWDVITGALYMELVDHKDVIRDLKFAPDGSLRLVSASRDGTLKVWDLEDDGNMFKTLRGQSKWLYSCAWSPDSSMLCSVGDNRAVLLWDMTDYTQLRRLQGHHHDVCCCDFSPDGALLATSSYDTRVIIWDPHLGTQIKELNHMFPPPSPIFAGGANDSFVRSVSFSHDGMHLVTVSDDGFVRFWDLESDSLGPGHVTRITEPLCCSYSPDGMSAAVGTRSGSVTLWLAPMRVLSLQHCCRLAIRRMLPGNRVNSIVLPSKLKKFVCYLN